MSQSPGRFAALMPNAPLGKCSQPGCPARTARAGRCETHQRQGDERVKAAQTWRPYDDPRWPPLRRQVLSEQRICATIDCDAPATVVDHIHPARTHPLLAFNRLNCQGLCQPCHSRKTAAENRFGGRPD